MSLYWHRAAYLKHISPLEAYPGLEAWISAFRAFPRMQSDRNGIFRPPLKTHLDPGSKIPNPDDYPERTFAECCALRATEILECAEAQHKPIYIMFSGGIDSTAVVSAFLQNFSLSRLNDRIKIVTSTESWIENPNFIRTYLIGRFEFISPHEANHFYDGRALLVTGDPNDYYIGRDQDDCMRALAATPEYAGDTYSIDVLLAYLRVNGVPETHARIWADILDQDRRRAPTKITTFSEMLWWARFNWTWQHIIFQSLALMPLNAPRIKSIGEYYDRVHHFFGSPEFQVWGMMMIKDRSSRKPDFRKYILDFTHDDDWVRHKGKFFSLRPLLQGRKLAIGFDEQFNPLYTPEELAKHYDPKNDFASVR